MPETVRIAAAGDVHCRPSQREQAVRAFAGLDAKADVLLLAGDLTTHGQPEQAEVLAEACAPLDIPIVAVLGNHDWHCNQVDECLPIWADAGIQVLDRSHTILDIGGYEVGVAGVKGFVGGFPGSHLPDFGEPSLRAIYAEAGEEAAALDRGLRDISHCAVRIGNVPVYNVSVPVMGQDYWVFELSGVEQVTTPIH